jgi:hypothetical protein
VRIQLLSECTMKVKQTSKAGGKRNSTRLVMGRKCGEKVRDGHQHQVCCDYEGENRVHWLRAITV